ncbi:MAG: choice-of-anchor J domain-containing protein [Bacteroidales bacterium]|nr:choice-of-anchor J domain-containing protein [Bacteroidales bacterium]
MKNIFSVLRKSTLIVGFIFYALIVNAQYVVNFEGEGELKPSYASATVNLSGLDWDMTDALITTTAAGLPEFINGERAARMRGYGTSSMTMLQNKSNGIGNITFLYRRYGTDTQVDWKIEYSTNNGSTWTQIGNAFTAPASDDVQTFSENVNVDGNVRVRIKRATEDGTVNRRLNIDDIVITDNTGVQNVATPVFSPPAGQFFGDIDVTISCTTPDASIFYTTDGSEPSQSSTPYTDPINISATTTLKARAYATGLDPSIIAQGTYTIITPIQVANLGELRAAFPSTDYFKINGEVVLTFQQTFRNQKYIQDANGAILIDDLSGKITTAYNLGDGITGMIGTVTEFGNMLQFVPAFDPGEATSTGNQIDPVEITITEMTANFEDYESQLVKIADATFADAGAAFENGLLYPISDNSKASAEFRTTFYDVDYIGTLIPSGAGNIVGILNSRTEGNYITSRSLGDLEWFYGEPTNYPTAFEATTTLTTIKLTWEDATGEVLPTGYVILASDEDNIIAPVDGVPVSNDPVLSDGLGAMNIAFGAEEYVFADLPVNVTYYFKIFSYTGAGSAIDYKNDGNPPSAEATIILTIIPEPTNYPTAFAAAATGSNIKLTWTDATGEVLPAGYLILGSSQNNFQSPADGTPVADDPNMADGVGAMNIQQGIQEYSFNGLEQQTTYYFKIFPYTNDGQYIDYKTDGEPPFAEATTATVELVTVINSTFNTDWEGWTTISVKGAELWDRNNTFGVDNTACAKMSGFANSQSNENEDWLISPALNLSNTTNEKLTFFSALGYTGPALNVKISTDYAGSGNPGDATWTDLTEQAAWPSGDPFWQWTSSGAIDISSYGSATAYVAFVYYSTSQNSATWEIDNVLVNGEGSNSISSPGQDFQTTIYPNPGTGRFNIQLSRQADHLEVFSLTGQLVYKQPLSGDQTPIDLTHLKKGVYLVKITDLSSGMFSTNRIIIN